MGLLSAGCAGGPLGGVGRLSQRGDTERWGVSGLVGASVFVSSNLKIMLANNTL